MTKRASEIGAAGEHVACATLLLAGHRATLAAAGLPYDIIADIAGKLVRIAVKSTLRPVSRPGRPGSKPRYGFMPQRRIRRNSGPVVLSYTVNDADWFAFVALDIMRVAFVPVVECPASLWLEANTDHVERRFGKRGANIAGFDAYSLDRVVTW